MIWMIILDRPDLAWEAGLAAIFVKFFKNFTNFARFVRGLVAAATTLVVINLRGRRSRPSAAADLLDRPRRFYYY